MQSIIRKVISFITMDVTNEDEAKDFAVLLRIISIAALLFNVINALYLISLYHYLYSLLSIVFVGISIGSFILTYENKTNMAFGLLLGSLVTSATIYTISIGWRYNYQWNILIAIMIIFYTLNIEMNVKLRYVSILSILLGTLMVLSYIFPVFREKTGIMSFIFDLSTTFYYIFTFSVLAYYFCTKFNIAEEKLRNYNKELQNIASHDALTSLPNRRSMGEHLSSLVYEYNRDNTPFAIAIADVDFFKKVNDNYGHDTGDYVLKTLAATFSRTMEGRGTVARWGGEEFLFTFEGMTGAQAASILNNMRTQIENTEFKYRDYTLNITVTLGVEEYSPITGLDLSISNADKKLYDGKQSGRNQVVF